MKYFASTCLATAAVLSIFVAYGVEAAQPETADPLFGSARHDRTIRLAMDDNQFDGERGPVHAGQTIRFVITNRSRLDHGFVVGERGALSANTASDSEDATSSSGGSHDHELPGSADAASPLVKPVDDLPLLTVPAGVTREILVHFPRTGEFIYTCPQTEHDSQMRGVITVLPAKAEAALVHCSGFLDASMPC
ncbi:MAG: hypothetical protein CME36_20555 [unclassified Hahellaceae]|nr:hypothetical protein [Hahellaceae bacterium]